ncbi:MAG: hypothetical protein K2G40_04995, partial [Muribaculaceae bacterium]|nr:hypothetical protein [Muribaculaceae bacterium]
TRGDSDYNDSELKSINTIALPLAPTTVLTYDDINNIFNLSVSDNSFNGKIEYVITESDNHPGNDVTILTYTEAIVLVNDINYIWARCSGDPNFRDSELTFLGMTKRRVLLNAPEVTINFDDLKNLLTLSVNDNNFKGTIKYFISESDQRPEEGIEFTTYTVPIQLSEDINYVWFFTSCDSEYKDSELIMVKTLKRELDTAPVPILKFDPVTNTFYLSISNTDFKGYIEYWVTQSSKEPSAAEEFELYNGPVTLTDNINYIWARCVGDPDFKDSSITFLMMTEAFVTLDAPEVNSSFDNRQNILTLSVQNQEFKGRIEYIISETEQLPEETANFLVYSAPIQLTEQINFIWYRTCGDSDFDDSELKAIKTIALPVAPVPSMSFDELSNVLTLSLPGSSFNGIIEYYLTEKENNLPEDMVLSVYSQPVVLEQDENYIWARASGDKNFRDSELTLLGFTKHKILKESPVPVMKFDPVENSFTLSINDHDFNGNIEYWISQTATGPGESQKGIVYKGQVTLEADINYIWARCVGDTDYKDSQFTLLGMTEAFLPLEAPEILLNFDPYKNEVTLTTENSQFNGWIIYAVMPNEDIPSEDNFLTYEAPISLQSDTNFIWAKTIGDISFEVDEIHLIGKTQALPYSPTPVAIHNPFMNTLEIIISDNEDKFIGNIFYAITEAEEYPDVDTFIPYTET